MGGSGVQLPLSLVGPSLERDIERQKNRERRTWCRNRMARLGDQETLPRYSSVCMSLGRIHRHSS